MKQLILTESLRAISGAALARTLHESRLSVATGAKDLAEAVTRIEAAARDATGFRQFVALGIQLTL